MKKLLLILLLFIITGAYSQDLIPQWFSQSFKKLHLDTTYMLQPNLKPAFLQTDFNGDGIKDGVATITEKKTGKKGFIVIFRKINQHTIFGAGKKLGKPGLEYGDDLKWANRWETYKDKIAYETKFGANGDIIGTTKKKLSNKGICIFQLQDGAPLAGFIVSWNGKSWNWIHQGE